MLVPTRTWRRFSARLGGMLLGDNVADATSIT